MPDNSLWNNLGLQGNTPDVDSPLQVELAKAMMAALAPKQQQYDPNVRGGWTASMVNALGNIHSAWYRDQALRVNKKLMGDHADAAAGTLGMGGNTSDNSSVVPKVMDYSQREEPKSVDIAKTNMPNQGLTTGSIDPSKTAGVQPPLDPGKIPAMARGAIAPYQFDQKAAGNTPIAGIEELATLDDANNAIEGGKSALNSSSDALAESRAILDKGKKVIAESKVKQVPITIPTKGKPTPQESQLASLPTDLERSAPFTRPALTKEGKYTDRVQQASRLGGPTEEDIQGAPEQNIKVAQSYVPQPAKPSSDSGNLIEIPGYRGPAPNVPYLPTQEQVKRYLSTPMVASDPEKISKYIEEYQKKAAPYEMKVPNGSLHITPKPGGGGDFKFFPTPETRDIKDIVPSFDKDGQLNYGLVVPGKVDQGGQPDMKRYEQFLEWERGQKGADTASQSLHEDKAKHINEAVDQGLGAGGALQTLHTMDALSKATPNMGRGPTKDFSLKAREFIENITGKTLPATEQMETFEKLNGVLASEATKAITSRGTNFDLQTFMRTNPSLGQTKKGTEMITDILQQEYRAKQAIGAMANKMRGSDVHSFNDKVQEYYKNNPIKFTATVNGQDVRVNTRPVTSREERDKLEVGDGYITPDGKLAIKK